MFSVGLATGLARAEVKPAGIDVHVYVFVPEPPLAPAFSCTPAPAHTVPGVAVAVALKGPPLIVIVTASVFEHVVEVDVAVSVKVVVDVRFTVAGSSTAGFKSCPAGLQLYVNGPVPVTVPFSVVPEPYGIVASVPAFTAGNEFTVTAVAADAALWHEFASVTLTV